jgi:hypothetical protein
LGAEADLNTIERRWLSPLALWTGILTGPLAWALYLGASYALVKWTCATQRQEPGHLITVAAFAMVAGASFVSWRAWRSTEMDEPTDGGTAFQRARFMAILGLTSSALFALTILAGALPRWIVDACS